MPGPPRSVPRAPPKTGKMLCLVARLVLVVALRRPSRKAEVMFGQRDDRTRQALLGGKEQGPVPRSPKEDPRAMTHIVWSKEGSFIESSVNTPWGE